MDSSDNTSTHEIFVQQLTENQNRMYAYIFSLLADRSRASDVLQETNLVLWRKVDEFQHSRPFLPWALAIARFQVLAHLRDHKRDRLLLDEELVKTLSAEAESSASALDAMRDALAHCMRALNEKNRKLVQHRYYRGMSIAEVAETLGRSSGSLKVALLRIRKQLANCVQKRIANGA